MNAIPVTVWIIVGFGLLLAIVMVVNFRRAPPAAPRTGVGGQRAQDALAAAQRGDLDPLRQALADVYGSDWDRRGLLLDLVAGKAPQAALDVWAARSPSDADAQLARGIGLVRRAWEARGSGTAGTVSAQGRNAFVQYLTDADAVFSQVGATGTTNPLPWSQRILCGRGLGIDHATAQALFAEATTRDPRDWLAHQQMLTYLTAKWHGSHEAMFAFARQAAAANPGSDVAMIVVAAHIERWAYTEGFEGDAKRAAAYLTDAEVRAECQRLYDGSIARDEGDRASTIKARNIAATWFYLVRDETRARVEIERIGNAFTEYPWYYLDEPERASTKAARWALGRR